MIWEMFALAFAAAAFTGALVLCQVGRAAGSPQARRGGAARRMGAERQPRNLASRRPFALLAAIAEASSPSSNLRMRWAFGATIIHRKLALRPFSGHVAARQPDPLAARR